jgi:thiamine biosynthesis lipoprotein
VRRFFGTSLIMVSMLGLSCRNRSDAPIVRQTTAMNTYVSITVYDEDVPRENIERAIDSAFAAIKRVEDIASDYKDSSEIGKANLAAGTDSVSVSDDLAELLRISLTYCKASDGALDITVGPLKTLWNFLSEPPRVPPPDSIRSALALVNYRIVELHDHTLYLPRKGMALDLGSIGKGFAIDRAAAILERAGIKRAIVDIGGKLSVRWEGTHGLDSTVATISVRHPRRQGSFLGTFRYGSGGVSTSGDYERFFISDGIRYHHLLDLKTGYPARGVVAVTVVAPTATDADAISTVAFLLGRERGMSYLRELPGVDGMIVYEQGDTLGIDLTPGLQGKFVSGGTHD